MTEASKKTLRSRNRIRGHQLHHNEYMREYRRCRRVRRRIRAQRLQWMRANYRWHMLYKRVWYRLRGVLCSCGRKASAKATIMLGQPVCREC